LNLATVSGGGVNRHCYNFFSRGRGEKTITFVLSGERGTVHHSFFWQYERGKGKKKEEDDRRFAGEEKGRARSATDIHSNREGGRKVTCLETVRGGGYQSPSESQIFISCAASLEELRGILV